MINNKCLNIKELKKNEDTWEDIEKRLSNKDRFILKSQTVQGFLF